MSDRYRYQKLWRLERDAGLLRTIDAAPVRAHLHRLIVIDGFSHGAVADAAGTSDTPVGPLLSGDQTQLRRATAEALLAVTPEKIRIRSNLAGFIPAHGARRRIQALLALGWRHEDISAAGGFTPRRSPTILHQPGSWITRATHDAVAVAYDALSMTPGPSARTRRRAEQLGYAPPLAWDDDAIDDPGATPACGWEPTTTHQAVDLDELMLLVNAGEDPARVLDRVGTNAVAVTRRAERHGRRDVVRAFAAAAKTPRTTHQHLIERTAS